MKCPFCGNKSDKVVDSREKSDGIEIRRRRECLNCNSRFTTYEYIADTPIMVLKRDNKPEPFNRDKLKRGIDLAVVKRPIDAKTVDDILNEIEDKCKNSGLSEITSLYIGELIMNRLRDLDEIAYIRFASVYRRFKDLGEFRRELEKL